MVVLADISPPLLLPAGRGTTRDTGVGVATDAPCAGVSVWSPVVLTVFRLLSTAAAAAVFLFASARSWSSIVSCATLATSGFFFELPQPRLPNSTARQTISEYLERVFIFFLS